MPVRRELAITAAAIAAAGALVGGVAAVSSASTTSQVANTGYTSVGSGEGKGQGYGRGGHAHTEVTGTELAKVTAAVKAKDSAVTVQRVQKDPDGSYDVIGTKDNSPVMLEVSKDLKTIQTSTGGPGGGGRGGHAHTEVTGTELAKVTAAVKAKDSAVTVQRVQKDPDGSYDVIGTKDSSPVMLEVSKDLKTIQTSTGGPGGGRGGSSLRRRRPARRNVHHLKAPARRFTAGGVLHLRRGPRRGRGLACRATESSVRLPGSLGPVLADGRGVQRRDVVLERPCTVALHHRATSLFPREGV